MRQARRSAFACFTLAATMLLVLCSGCGGSSKSSALPAPTTLSAAQSTAVATQIEQTFVSASAGMGTDWCGNPYAPTEEFFCTIPVAFDGVCAGGGTIAITGSLTGDLDYSDTGAVTALLTVMPANCAIPGTTLVMTGDPNLTVTGSGLEFYGGLSTFSVTETGSITYGPKPAGTCQTDLTITASFIGDAQHTVKSCTLTGTACGETINQSCM